jgi:hypothetical protein
MNSLTSCLAKVSGHPCDWQLKDGTETRSLGQLQAWSSYDENPQQLRREFQSLRFLQAELVAKVSVTLVTTAGKSIPRGTGPRELLGLEFVRRKPPTATVRLSEPSLATRLRRSNVCTRVPPLALDPVSQRLPRSV